MSHATTPPVQVKPGVLRTPEECFARLADFPYEPHYVEVDGLRVHYVDEGPPGSAPLLLIHGEPTWCYLYRKMIPILTAAGHRCVAPDLIGFGRSDKLARREDYSYQLHVDVMNGFVRALDLNGITLFGQDWGGLIGLRVLADNPKRFARLIVANTGLPTGEHKPTEGFLKWLDYSQTVPDFHVGGIVRGGCTTPLSAEAIAAYNAPFPSDAYKEAAQRLSGAGADHARRSGLGRQPPGLADAGPVAGEGAHAVQRQGRGNRRRLQAVPKTIARRGESAARHDRGRRPFFAGRRRRANRRQDHRLASPWIRPSRELSRKLRAG